jgi:hypothetical protein
MNKILKQLEKTKTKLINRCKKKGIYENFGQREVMILQDTYIDISDYSPEMNNIRGAIDKFYDWTVSYNG